MLKKTYLSLLIIFSVFFTGCIIKGTIVDKNGIGVPDVKMTLSGDASMSTTTDSDGNYQFGESGGWLATGNYIVTPKKSDCFFTPANNNVTITPQDLGQYKNLPWPVSGCDFVQATDCDIEEYEITIDRVKEGSSISYYFCADLWGTGIHSVKITSPLNQTYWMRYDIYEDEQWSYDQSGSRTAIESEFPDGAYTIDVLFSDGSSEKLTIRLGGTYPPFPIISSTSRERLVWNSWVNPVGFSSIEVEIASEGEELTSGWLPYPATYYEIPAELIQGSKLYDIEISFQSTSYPSAFKKSFTVIHQVFD